MSAVAGSSDIQRIALKAAIEPKSLKACDRVEERTIGVGFPIRAHSRVNASARQRARRPTTG
jgi:hypothetical protein